MAKEKKTYAYVSWRLEDIDLKASELGIELSRQEVEAFLDDARVSSQIQSDMINRGWDSIDTLLREKFPDRVDQSRR